MFLDIIDRVLMEKEKAQLEAQDIYLQEKSAVSTILSR